jgi:hypothetical protein
VFISYPHKGETLRNKSERHLKLLYQQNIIDAWYDRTIIVGAEWGKL